MTQHNRGIIIGVLGQWSSGKTVAARTLIGHLGGESEVLFLADRVLFASQVVDHILELEDSEVVVIVEEEGRQRIDGELVTIWLRPGKESATVRPDTLDFRVHDDQVLYAWRRRAKDELAHEVRERSAGGKPIVTEVAFGPNVEPAGEQTYGRTIPDLFARLESAGVEPGRAKWIIVEASFDIRSRRNEARQANSQSATLRGVALMVVTSRRSSRRESRNGERSSEGCPTNMTISTDSGLT